MIADIKVPDSSIARQAEEYARSVSDDLLYNHVMRCYYFSELIAQQENSKADRELIFLSATLHDLGFTDAGRGPNRFEIEGAHAARNFLLEKGVPDDRSWLVWNNIALHTWDINLFRDDAARLTQLGIFYDLTAVPGVKLDPRDVAEVVRRYPRLQFKKGIYNIFRDELDRKQPYPHLFHFCTVIEHDRSGVIEFPDPRARLESAAFDE